MKSEVINTIFIVIPCGVFRRGDVQQFPLPHGGYHLLGNFCNVFRTPPQGNPYIPHYGENKRKL